MKLTPDLLLFNDGSPVEASSWPERRQELANTIIPAQFGGLPPVHENIDIMRYANSRICHWPGVQYRAYQIGVGFSKTE